MRWAVKLTKPVLLLVSFAMSLVLFLYVQSQTSPTGIEKLDLVVHAKNLPVELTFDQEGSTVNFDARGPRDKLDRLIAGLKDNPNFITAVTNLGFISPANVRDKLHEDKLRLVVIAPNFPDIEFLQNQVLNGVIERKKTRDVKIRVEFPSPPTPDAWNDYDRDSFEAIPNSITLTGAASEVDTASPIAIVNPKEAEQTGAVRVKLSLPRNLTSSPPIDTVEIHPTRRERQAYVNVIFAGHPLAGFTISNYYVVTPSNEPSSTTIIRGPGGIVDRTSTIDATIDISGLNKGYTYTVVPKMPRQLELVDSPLRIRVDVVKSHR